jgi:hypothetical protein
MDPTEAGFESFLTSVVGIPSIALPATPGYGGFAFNLALDLVNPALQVVCNANPAYPTIYALAVYNLATNNFVLYQPDQVGQTYFADLRAALNVNVPTLGIVNSTSDVSTSQGSTLPDFVKGLTLGDLQLIQTPWGRAYLALAQNYGEIWGLS